MAGCTQCGSCCRKYGMRLEASPLDIARWRLDDRKDILAHVGIEYAGGEVAGGRLWVDGEGKRVKECPFLELRGEKYYCGIHDSKPEVCARHYCDKYF
ncbi:MAG TPA: YkgJ family cysteine cluster protein [Methanocella sp.]|nr:YkgJ family cysteine cluster protein [Methanocella sp.]